MGSVIYQCDGSSFKFESFSDFRAGNVPLIAIFKGLLGENRFNNQTFRPLSVLEHSINCELEAFARGYDFETRKLCFTHDFSEAVIRDMPTPYKNLLPDYRAAEDGSHSR